MDEYGVRETVAERIGRSYMLLFIPTVTYKILLCIISNELLTALVTAITSKIYKDIALSIILDGLRIGAVAYAGTSSNLLGQVIGSLPDGEILPVRTSARA